MTVRDSDVRLRVLNGHAVKRGGRLQLNHLEHCGTGPTKSERVDSDQMVSSWR